MILDIRPILRGETDCIEIDYTLTPEKISGVEFETAKVSGKVVDTGGCITLSLSASVEYKGECARCLDEVSGVFEMEFERTVADEKTLSEEALLEEDGIYAVMKDGRLGVDDELIEVTPKSIRLRKRILNTELRLKAEAKIKRGQQ